jgi:hypothetical protein
MTLRDADLNQYQVEWNYYDYFDYMAFPTSSSISPGERGRGWIAFQAPETSSGYVFALDAAPNGGDNIFVALGPEPAAFEPPAEMLTPNPNARRVGEVIKQGDVALAVLGWNTSQGRVGVQPDPGHKFLVVDAMLVSRSSQAENLYTPALEPEVRDASGYRYKTDPEHYYGDQPAASLFEGGLTPGEQVRGQFLYQVREASSGYVFIFDPKWLFGEDGGDLIVVDLGAQPVSLEPPAELLTP